MDTEHTNQSLEYLLSTVRRRAGWVALCTVLVAGAAFGFSKPQAKKYTATAVLVFESNQRGQQIAGLSGASSSESQQAQTSTNLRLLQLGDVAAKTARALRPLGYRLTPGEVSAALSVGAQGESNLVNLSATATSPVLTEKIANTYAKLFVAEQQSRNRAYYAAALKLVKKKLAALSARDRASAVGLELQSRAQW